MSLEPGLWIETGGGLWSDTEVSEDELVRVRENMHQAAQLQGQIAQTSKQSKQLAQLLVLLLQHITDERLIDDIFVQLTEHKIPIPAIFAEFLPRLVDKVQLNVSGWPFASLLPQARTMTHSLEGVVGRISTIKQHFPQLTVLPKSYRQAFILDITEVYGYTTLSSLDAQQVEELRHLLEKSLADQSGEGVV